MCGKKYALKKHHPEKYTYLTKKIPVISSGAEAVKMRCLPKNTDMRWRKKVHIWP